MAKRAIKVKVSSINLSIESIVVIYIVEMMNENY